MPLTGKLLVQVTFKSQTGGFSPVPGANPPEAAGSIFTDSVPNTGTATFDYGLNGILRLTGDINADLTREELPVGFEVTSVASQIHHRVESGFVSHATWSSPFSELGFSGVALASSGPALGAVGFSSTPGFTESFTIMNNARAVALLYPFEVTFTLNCSAAASSGSYRTDPSGLGDDYPYYWEIADWEIPDVIGPPPSSPPFVEVVPGGINVTAGPGTTTVVVSNPGTVPSIVVTVTPGVVVFVPIVPPNNPVVTVTPYNGPVIGTPTVVAVPPAFDITMSGGIDLGGSPTLQFIGNPSGIYTIVPGKSFDTLYERIPAVTSQDVKIPDPYIVTALVGE